MLNFCYSLKLSLKFFSIDVSKEAEETNGSIMITTDPILPKNIAAVFYSNFTFTTTVNNLPDERTCHWILDGQSSHVFFEQGCCKNNTDVKNCQTVCTFLDNRIALNVTLLSPLMSDETFLVSCSFSQDIPTKKNKTIQVKSKAFDCLLTFYSLIARKQ